MSSKSIHLTKVAQRVIKRPGRWGVMFAIPLLLSSTVSWLIDPLRTLQTLRRIPDTNVYVMDYYADYQSSKLKTEGMNPAAIEDSLIELFFPAPVAAVFKSIKRLFVPAGVNDYDPDVDHCSTVSLQSADHQAVYFGRNFDWYHDAVLILRMHDRHSRRGTSSPTSIAVLDLHYVNLDRPNVDKLPWVRRLPLLFAPYFVMDGMNRHGLALSILLVADSKGPNREPTKPDIIYPTLARVILDHAKSVEEAVQIFQEYNIYFPYTAIHFMLLDESGDSRVVEFVSGKVRVTTPAGDRLWQLCTNDILWGKTEAQLDLGCQRYQTGSALAEDIVSSPYADGITESDAIKVTKSMTTPGFTMWSSVYELRNRTFLLYYKTQSGIAYRDSIPLQNLHDEKKRTQFWQNLPW